ncbi:SEC-C motif-containing protein [Lachnospiraceae bacterium KH1T2]|nr:SEC-C motif-containing protein [Lachnospiraceae bacterium KH1T2]
MNLDKNEIREQVKQLLSTYPKLNIVKSDNSTIHLAGSIYVYRNALNYTVQKNYMVEITIPISESNTLPKIRETGNVISDNYPHRYQNGELCLETETSMRLRFIDGLDLVAWMDEYVEPYFFSYEYYTRFGKYPFGERPHYLDGIINTYQDIFHTTDFIETSKLLIYAAESVYRGHATCPCGSGVKLRNCHGKYILPFALDKRKRNIAISDLNFIRKEISKYE